MLNIFFPFERLLCMVVWYDNSHFVYFVRNPHGCQVVSSFPFFTSSDDGYYATLQPAPKFGGRWSVQAVSLSQYHGLRAAAPRTVLRTRPLTLNFDGVPAAMKKDEVLPQVNLTIQSHMPVNMNVSGIL